MQAMSVNSANHSRDAGANLRVRPPGGAMGRICTIATQVRTDRGPVIGGWRAAHAATYLAQGLDSGQASALDERRTIPAGQSRGNCGHMDSGQWFVHAEFSEKVA